MGNFANGTEGMAYEATYCERCKHYGDGAEDGCPVWGIHLFYNSEQNSNESVHEILSMLIPMTDGCPEQCTMFTQVTDND